MLMESTQDEEIILPRESETVEESDKEDTNKDDEKDGESNDVEKSMPKKRKVWSSVWEHFNRNELSDKSVDAFCKYCSRKYKYDSKNGTSKLTYHLKHCEQYKKKLKKANDVKQMLLTAGNVKEDGTMDLKNYVFDEEAARIAFARAVIVHELPFTLSSYTFFRIFLKLLNPAYKPVSHPTLKEDCMKEFRKEKKKLYKVLGDLPCRVSLTSDMWTSDQNKGYMSLTCHYIDEKWKLKKKIIAFCLVDGSHTGEVIAEEIHNRLFEWNIDKKIFSIVLDNASANNAAVEEMIPTLSRKGALLLGGKFFHVRCCAHILNLVVQYGFDEFKLTIRKIRESVKYIKHNSQRQKKFNHVAEQVKAPKKMLILDIPTRWNSTYMMLDVALLFRDAFSRFAEIDKGYIYEPSNEDWEVASIFCEFLKWFYDLTNLFSSTTTPTSNLYFVEICELHLMLSQGCQNENYNLASMSRKMLEKFMKYWSAISPLFAIASILDPQIKMKSIEWYYPLIYGMEAEYKINEVRDALKDLYNEYAMRSPFSNVEQPLTRESGTNAFIHGGDRNTLVDDGSSSSTIFLGRIRNNRSGFNKFLEQTSQEKPSKSDLELYLDEGIHPHHKDFDILTWWKLNAPKYPIVSQMVRDILAIPTTTVASESAFSTGGRILDKYRLSMHASTVEALICGQDWIRSEFKESGASVDDRTSLGAFISNLSLDDGVSTSSTSILSNDGRID